MSTANDIMNYTEDDSFKSVVEGLQQGLLVFDSQGLVTGPSSDGLAEFFGGDIVGQSIYSTLFKYFDVTSQDYAQLQTVFTVCFGDSELQWDLVSHLLPVRFNIENHSKRKKDKSEFQEVRALYSPVWDEDRNLEKISVIIFAANSEKEKTTSSEDSEFKFVQELIKFTVPELESFFGSAFSLVGDSKNLLNRLNLKKDNLQVIFRNVHTLKGNSHLMEFSDIVDRAHTLEYNTKHIDLAETAQAITSDDKKLLSEGLDEILSSIQKYSRIAKDVLRVSNQYNIRLTRKLHHLLVRLEIALEKMFKSSQMSYSSVLDPDNIVALNNQILVGALEESETRTVQRILAMMADVALHLDNSPIPEMTNKIANLIEAVRNGNLLNGISLQNSLSKPYEQISREVKAMYLQKEMPIFYVGSASHWVSVLYSIFHVSDLYYTIYHEKGLSSNRLDTRNRLLQEVKNLNRLCADSGFSYLQATSAQILWQLNQPKISGAIPEVDCLLGEVWLYAQMIFLLDSAYRTDQKARESQRALISEFKFGRILTEQIREEAVKNQTLYLSTLKALADDGHHPYSLYKMFTYFAHDKSFDSNKFGDYLKDRKFDFIWRDIDLPMLDRYFDILKLQSNSESLSELLQSQPDDIGRVMGLFLSHGGGRQGYLKVLDLFYLFELYIEKEETIAKRVGVQSLKIMQPNIERLRLTIEELERNITFDNLKELRRTFEGLLGVPVKPSLLKLCKASEPVSLDLGKLIDFRVYGDDVTMDSQTISVLTDSITHLLRNSIDHGIETPEKRRKSGKDPKATIEIQCSESSKGISFHIRDDGAGIEVDRVAAKAIQMKHITKNQLDKMTVSQKLGLIFLPRLTTKVEATNISGRGIGLDSVKADVEKVGGHLQVESDLGFGSTFTIYFRR